MCRLSLAIPLTARALGSARWDSDIRQLNAEELMVAHNQVITLLQGDREYGAYDAVKMMIGQRGADMLKKNGELKSRGYPVILRSVSAPSFNSAASSSKRTMEDLEDFTDEIEIVDSDDQCSFASNSKRRRF